ncbi:MAG: hypothetical protein JXA20_03415 [Spirochaetes bacterium]|nr:hypothetical protein [Spirochaetota bacterium]
MGIRVQPLLLALLVTLAVPAGVSHPAGASPPLGGALPGSSSALYKKGVELARAGDIAGAIPLFERSVALSPYSCLGHYGLGKAYLHTGGKLDLAVKHLRISVSLDKGFAKGYFYLGMGYYLRGYYIQAIHAFDQAYRKDYTYIEALYNIGAMYDLMDNDYKSGLYFNRYLRERAGDEELLFQ